MFKEKKKSVLHCSPSVLQAKEPNKISRNHAVSEKRNTNELEGSLSCFMEFAERNSFNREDQQQIHGCLGNALTYPEIRNG